MGRALVGPLAHKGPGGSQGPGPQEPRGAHKGPAHKSPGGPQWPGPQGHRGPTRKCDVKMCTYNTYVPPFVHF